MKKQPKKIKATKFVPVHPMETINEMSTYQLFGEGLARQMSVGLTDFHATLLSAMFGVDRQFFINLQKNYDEDMKKK